MTPLHPLSLPRSEHAWISNQSLWELVLSLPTQPSPLSFPQQALYPLFSLKLPFQLSQPSRSIFRGNLSGFGWCPHRLAVWTRCAGSLWWLPQTFQLLKGLFHVCDRPSNKSGQFRAPFQRRQCSFRISSFSNKPLRGCCRMPPHLGSSQ